MWGERWKMVKIRMIEDCQLSLVVCGVVCGVVCVVCVVVWCMVYGVWRCVEVCGGVGKVYVRQREC